MHSVQLLDTPEYICSIGFSTNVVQFGLSKSKWSLVFPGRAVKQEGLTVIIMNGKRQKQFPRLVASSEQAQTADEPSVCSTVRVSE